MGAQLILGLIGYLTVWEPVLGIRGMYAEWGQSRPISRDWEGLIWTL